MEPFITVGIVVALVGGVYAISEHFRKKRVRAFQALAEQRGLTYTEREAAPLAGVPGFSLLDHGRSRRFDNIIQGKKDAGTVLVADYRYVTGSGKNQSVSTFTLCFLEATGVVFPPFFLRPQHRLLDAMGKLFGGQDINFDDDPEFSKAFVLQSEIDENRLRRVCSPAVRGHLLGFVTPTLRVEARASTLLVAHVGHIDVEKIDDLIAGAVTLRRLLAYELQDRGA